MTDYLDLPTRDHDGNYHFVVEAPRGSIVKLAYDPKREAFVFKRALALGLSYPYDWGFIPSTRAPDGDPIDALMLFEAPSWPGVIVPAKPIAIVRVTQKGRGGKRERNDRIIVLPASDARYDDLQDIPAQVRDDLGRFFVAATEKTDKDVVIDDWEGRGAAKRAIDEAAQAYARSERKGASRFR